MNGRMKEILIKIKEKVVKKPYLYGFLIIIILLLLPALIFILYFIGDHGYNLVYTSLTVGDALGFYGSLLSFLGTISLGALALWQNYKLNKVNQTLTALQLEEYTPYLIIESGDEADHIDVNRNPDTTQSILPGYKGFVTFNTVEDKASYEAKENHLIQLCQNNSMEAPERVAKVEKAQIELKQLAKKTKSTTMEHYIDTFWILKKDDEQLGNSFSNAKNLERISLKLIFKNPSQAKIKQIIINKMNFKCCEQNWIFVPNTQKNNITQLISKDQTFVFYINLFWDKNDTELYKILKLFDMYQVLFELTLITAGNNKQQEKITSDWGFGKLSESTFELM